jgi:hypothetical protein
MPAGCPFTGFGDFAWHRCAFFVVRDFKTGDEGCAITSIYSELLINHLLHQCALLENTLKDSKPDPVYARIAESIARILRSLAVLSTSQSVDSYTKQSLQELKSLLMKDLKTFLELP